MASLPVFYLPILLSHIAPWLAYFGILLGILQGAAYTTARWPTVSPYSPKFRAVPRPMLWLYLDAFVATLMVSLVGIGEAFRQQGAAENAALAAAASTLVATAMLFIVVSIMDSGGVNPFIDLVNLTFFDAKTYRQIREERETVSAAAEERETTLVRRVDAEDSGH